MSSKNRKRIQQKTPLKRPLIYASIAILAVILIALFSTSEKPAYSDNINENTSSISSLNNDIEGIETEENKELDDIKPDVYSDILLTFAGDCTLGTDTNFAYSTSLPAMFENQGKNYSYFFKNVYDIFSNDDYTLVNLETTFTDAKKKAYKGEGVTFHFKGPKEYANILTSSSIEGVSIANNHTYDYGEQGLKDTVNTLKSTGIEFCGKGYKIERDIKGMKFVFLGYEGWNFNEEIKKQISKDIKEAKEKGAIVIPYFHWGIERQSKPYDVQVNLARYSIDQGADMVLGSHPHVIQTIENYKGKLIVYSFGNFSFGGNSNPSDKRTFILQTKISTKNNTVTSTSYKVIPASISSVDYKNDYAPTPLNDERGQAIMDSLNNLSPTLKGRISSEFFTLE